MPLSPAQEFAKLFRLGPEEAVRYLRGRGLLTETFDWRDLWQDEHARQFTVSRLARLDLLAAMHEGLVAAMDGDLSRRDWMRAVEDALRREGWWGTNKVRDTEAARMVETTFDAPRLKLIFDMNTRMASSAGLWERVERNRRTHPYVRYITRDDSRVREAHRQWHGLTLPADDPFWATHWPPNGWRCRCRVMSMTAREYELRRAAGTIDTARPPVQTRAWLNKRTGEEMEVPVGIDPGFDYNVGVARARAAALEQLAEQKLAAAPEGIAQAARAAGLHERPAEGAE
ncbi:phage minor head protein [Thauera aromatica]|uniref:phage head morphogenesis protein n=1 Tax=Thauera aromatica TaxID=59405 RepID=UPI001FFDCC9E|nr:phage minor head protein [Thauera aromatica]MCK2095636.1 minor capsid protein [Thauera aromatica]